MCILRKRHIHASSETRILCRRAALAFKVSDIWENVQGRGHINISIVIRLCHRDINSRYTRWCTLGKNHTYVAIVTKLSKGKGISIYTWEFTLGRNLLIAAIGINFCSFFCNLVLHRYIHSREKTYLCKKWS